MKKRRLKSSVKVALGVILVFMVGLLLILGFAKRVEFFDNNIKECGSNYCEGR